MSCISQVQKPLTLLLTHEIQNTYLCCKEQKKNTQNKAKTRIDKDGHLLWRINEVLANRYQLIKGLGKGSFGQVIQSIDLVTGEQVALKVIRKDKNFYEQAKLEVQILYLLNSRDQTNNSKIVRLKDTFNLSGHFCMVFELLSYNLYDFLMKKNGSLGLSLVRRFAFQILSALHFLQQPDIRVIHCDLKPENIVLVSPNKADIKIIDFGSSCTPSTHMYKYIQSRYYRSPEVVMGLPYSHPIDMWSLGCILPELLTTEPLFPARSEVELLVMMGALLGMPPNSMIKESHRARKLFIPHENDENYDFHPTLQPLYNKKKKLRNIIGVDIGGPLTRTPGERMERDELEKFCDLCLRMLSFDPNKRITPREALAHPFFQSGIIKEINPLFKREEQKMEEEPLVNVETVNDSSRPMSR
ncbi:protein kinase domain containing protein [Entamoeba histolytica HM-1:IMSS-B]|uniref:dual-specificity kinase n=6 Tax=Entamoeba histolytica TaxID=5759 RepID=C4LW33_ENTH1|nr:protein kinase domain containing protein [Entamoeba histolytica HM-1:IMSS]EMD47603.1 dual specificity tyrosinephosphorylation-regulated kinase, putative [Entamoeba histolytica KU27]EMH72053.1 protein kinase domain containing protein [Entamoeba histolytica HM-1:IMSS-B]EMS14372.1 dual specificity tyrosine-phosphorylation-regulated kinase 1A, putative [Entamoeba histolytica HM-3:IMSS]ENY60034.1 dual specificity tyrosine-phosphorylation-regulated kinase 1A, putative [Entamoeba histolytica HM-1:I|eukprot:XP_654642.1 protein kinase domain containing protein [Entamoeba histolytica HM-1:IMSS]